MARKPHHDGKRYITESARIRTLATANPAALCWRCGRTLAAHPTHRDGKPQRWTAGHTIDGSKTWQPWTMVDTLPPPGDWLAPEASRCNSGASNTTRRPRSGWA